MCTRFYKNYVTTIKPLIPLNYHKIAKPSTRMYCTEKNINACKNLTSKMIDSGNFLAGEALATTRHSVVLVWGLYVGDSRVLLLG